MNELDAQIRKSIETTMRGRPPVEEDVRALTAFVRTLPPPPPRNAITGPDASAIERGRRVFESRRCDHCHTPPEYTSAAAYDVGLSDELGNSKFNPPSLRGVGQRDALFHDNRVRRLPEVFTKFRHQLNDRLSEHDLADLVAFLRSL